MADDDRGPVQGVVAGDRIVDIGLEVELLKSAVSDQKWARRLSAWPFPATLGEVAQVVLPQPGARQLAVEVVERAAARTALGQP